MRVPLRNGHSESIETSILFYSVYVRDQSSTLHYNLIAASNLVDIGVTLLDSTRNPPFRFSSRMSRPAEENRTNRGKLRRVSQGHAGLMRFRFTHERSARAPTTTHAGVPARLLGRARLKPRRTSSRSFSLVTTYTP